MAKAKASTTVQNRSLYSRISFLHQASAYLALSPAPSQSSENGGSQRETEQRDQSLLAGMARRLATDLRSVSLKTKIRMNPAMKQFVCKYCDEVLVEGRSCTSFVENKSRGGRKPWADVLVRRCHTCGREKRYPVNGPKKRTQKQPAAPEASGEA